MDKSTRNNIQRATQAGRTLLERAFSEQLEGSYDILLDGTIAEQPGSHLDDRQKLVRKKLVETMAHKCSTGLNAEAAVQAYRREAAFTTLNRFVALKMLEARDLVQECVSKGEDSSGFKEFTALAPGLVAVEDKGYRLYIETLFDEIGQEVKVLFDRRDVASLLWPDRQTLLELLAILNAPELASVWAEDETIGWVYQYFNGDEERTKMRKASRAPRNSRELAVRNQFFTPRYVVQFLTDNTLGRTWYEMMQGETRLAHLDYLVRRLNEVFLADGESAPESEADDSELSQEELLQQTVYVPFRAKKDPRDLRILDPACGSGHFLLYAFELLVTIYEEAWSDAGAAAFTETGTQLRVDYGSIEELRRAMPELILRHNLHGVDIDPRAAQIAALALWMRAQRAYNQFEVGRAERPSITKTNIVVAEPMPGDAELVDEFATSLKPAVLGDLFKKMVEEMKLAGELGSLLKIEESIAKAVKDAEEAHWQEGLFAEKIESQDFWDTADEKIIAALGSFSQSAAGGAGIRRQLFAGDAAQGVALIELSRKRFDAIVMNPPFGEPSTRSKIIVETSFPASKGNILAHFVERAADFTTSDGKVGAIVSRAVFFLSSMGSFRTDVLSRKLHTQTFCDLGEGVLEAMVETAAVTFDSKNRSSTNKTFFRLLIAAEKQNALTGLVSHVRNGALTTDLFMAHPSDFSRLIGTPYVYWVSRRIIRQLAGHCSLQPHGADIRVGLQTGDDFRFLRLWFEVPAESILTAPGDVSDYTRQQYVDQTRAGSGWAWYSKIDKASTFLASLHLLVNWKDNGHELKASHLHRGDSVSRYVRSENDYFRPGISYMLRSSRLMPYVVPAGVIPTAGRSQIYPKAGIEYWVLALAASNIASAVARFRGEEFGRPKLQNSMVAAVPFVPPVTGLAYDCKAHLCAEIANKRAKLSSDETSIHFSSPPFAKNLLDYRQTDRRSLLGTALDLRIAAAFGIRKEEFPTLERDLLDSVGLSSSETDFSLASEDVEDDRNHSSVDAEVAIISYGVGVCFGRWAARLTAEAPLSGETLDLFAPLPSVAPADRSNQPEALALSAQRSNSTPLVLVDDPGHREDLAGQVCRLLETYEAEASVERGHVDSVDLWHQENTIRFILAAKYFAFHLKQYSMSRRKAPIYWQLATPSASYSVWCYYHRLTRDTFFRVANDYVTSKVDHEQRKLNALHQEAGPDPSSKQRKAIDAQETFVAELRAFKVEVNRIAPLWNPNLNDGVIINFAPLWRLVPQHKPWQKECKKVWDKLCKGDYDWAHLAMHLWPERVVPKCQDDRSLAIAHGLEDDFWHEDDNGKWQKQQVSSDRVEALVAERASTAVKAALDDLLSAPTPGGTPKRRSRTRGDTA